MLDLKWIRGNAGLVQLAAVQKGIDVSVQELLNWDDRRRIWMKETESLREQRNLGSARMSALLQAGEQNMAAALRESLRTLNEELVAVEAKLAEAERAVKR